MGLGWGVGVPGVIYDTLTCIVCVSGAYLYFLAFSFIRLIVIIVLSLSHFRVIFLRSHWLCLLLLFSFLFVCSLSTQLMIVAV